MQLMHVAGARPNFMKLAPVHRAFSQAPTCSQRIVHTGQHYDAKLSDIFFEQLEIPQPDVSLDVGSGSHGAQTGEIMIRFEREVLENRPEIVLVYGDVNSTVAAALVCTKLGIPVAHVEAGLRSFDREMPEEINRLVTDQISDLLLTSSPEAEDNLVAEGVAAERIRFVGNVMIDTLQRLLPQARLPEIDGLTDTYALVTLHRPSNVDDPDQLREILRALNRISERIQLVFPIHPRTKARIEALGPHQGLAPHILLLDPTGYLESVALQKHARVVITDSGGLQEESTSLGVPCLTVRRNTERPVTVTEGTNTLVGQDMDLLTREVDKVLTGAGKDGRTPRLWDGAASERIVEAVTDYFRHDH